MIEQVVEMIEQVVDSGLDMLNNILDSCIADCQNTVCQNTVVKVVGENIVVKVAGMFVAVGVGIDLDKVVDKQVYLNCYNDLLE